MSRDRSHQLPQSKEPHGGAKVGLGKDTEPCGVWHLVRIEGGICACRGGEGSVFFKGRALYSVAHEGKQDMK